MKRIFGLLVLLNIHVNESVFAQPYFPVSGHVFNDLIIPRVDIFMEADSLADMYINLYSDHLYPCTFIFNDGVTIDSLLNVGIGLRGNTSQSAEKKSFKISFNTFEAGRKFYELEKMNLNGEHNDPSIIRSKLYWETLESMNVPGPRANHVEVYINGDYYGLYINVEHIDEKFVKSRFGNNNGNLYKCLWPADLNFISNDPNDYKLESSGKRVYELQTNTLQDDYTDLKDFISIINNTTDPDFPAALESFFNVNSFLRAYAVDVATGNWDSYSVNINNYYLYHNSETAKFEFIPYDTDNSYGIDWFGIDWGTRNIYNWYSTSQNPVLIERIFDVPEYVDRFTYFMKQLQQGMMNTTVVFPIIDSYLTMISPSAQNDIYRTLDYGWSYNDFLDSYTMALGGHVDYGVKPFISARHSATSVQFQNPDVIPIISNVLHSPKVIHAGDSIKITAWIEDENDPASVQLVYMINNSSFISLSMFDDGLHYDGAAGDEIFGTGIEAPSVGDSIKFRVEATDINNQTGNESRQGLLNIVVEPVPPLFINEVMASNTTAAADEFGEPDDWLEVYNAGSAIVNAGNIFLTDEFNNPNKWRLADELIPANGFALIWCDEQTYQGDYHASFKLNSATETVWLYEGTGVEFILLDSVSWQLMPENLTIGYYPDGVAPIISLTFPTPGYSNVGVGMNEIFNSSLQVFPNPFSQQLIIEYYVDNPVTMNIRLINSLGEEVLNSDVNFSGGAGGIDLSESIISRLPSGIYFLNISSADNSINFRFNKKLIKIE